MIDYEAVARALSKCVVVEQLNLADSRPRVGAFTITDAVVHPLTEEEVRGAVDAALANVKHCEHCEGCDLEGAETRWVCLDEAESYAGRSCVDKSHRGTQRFHFGGHDECGFRTIVDSKRIVGPLEEET